MLFDALTTVTILAARLPEPARGAPPPAPPRNKENPPRNKEAPPRKKEKPPAAWAVLLAALVPFLA